MKRTITILLAMLLCLNLAVTAFGADTCIVAGCAALCGSEWQPDDPNNAMTLKGNVFEKVYHNVPVGSYEFKTVYNGAWLEGANLAFAVVTACDVTITYDPTTGVAAYSGSGIGKATVQVTDIYVAGEAGDTASGWLNGESWNAAAVANKAIYTVDGVYSLYMKDIPAGTYAFKFAADGAWTQNWGGAFGQFNTPTDAISNGDNISFTLTEKHHVTLTLDLTGDSAKFTVTLDGKAPVPAPDPVVEQNYFVAGEQALCGVNWEANTPANQMTKGADGIYSKTFKKVTQGTYQLKITDGTWDNCWGGDGPEGNYQFSTGAGDVTVKFDPATKKISVVLPGQAEPKPVDPTPAERYFVAGEETLCGTPWEANTPANQMTKGADGLYTKTFKNVAKGTYQLKVTDGTWDNSWGGDGPEGNYQFSTGAGDVTVKFDPATKKISVVLPGQAEPKPVDPTPAERYFVAGEETLCGTPWEANTPANQMTKGADGLYTKTFKNVAKGTYQLKVTDGTWDNSWGGDGPEGNYQFSTEAGDVTVKFNPATKQISVVTPGQPEPSGPKYYVSGNCKAMGDWNAAPAQCQMRLRSDGSYDIVFKQLPAGEYEFKVTDGTWNNSWGENGGNVKLKLPETANVGIYFTLNNGQGDIKVVLNPPMDDVSLLPTIAALLCVTICGCLLLMNKKKLI